jgi:hypothetical protein
MHSFARTIFFVRKMHENIAHMSSISCWHTGHATGTATV